MRVDSHVSPPKGPPDKYDSNITRPTFNVDNNVELNPKVDYIDDEEEFNCDYFDPATTPEISSSMLECYDLSSFNELPVTPVGCICITKTGDMFKPSSTRKQAYIRAQLDGKEILLLGDSGNSFWDVISEGLATSLQLQKIPLKQPKFVRSVSNHFIKVQHAARAKIDLIAPSGHSVSFLTTLYIIPGNEKQPVILCVQNLSRLGLLDFMAALQSIVDTRLNDNVLDLTDNTLHNVVETIDYIMMASHMESNSNTPIASSASQFVKQQTRSSKISPKPIHEFHGNKVQDNDIFYDPEDIDDPVTAPPLFPLPTARTAAEKEVFVKSKLAEKFDLVHPSKSGMKMEVWKEAREYALLHWQAWRQGLGNEPLSLLPIYDIRGRVNVAMPQLPVKPPQQSVLENRYDSIYLRNMCNEWRYLYPFSLDDLVEGSRVHITPLKKVLKNPVTKLEDVDLNTFRPTLPVVYVNSLYTHPFLFPPITESWIRSIRGNVFANLDLDNFFFSIEKSLYTRTWFAQYIAGGVYLSPCMDQGINDATAHGQCCMLEICHPVRDKVKPAIDDILVHCDDDYDWLFHFKWVIDMCIRYKIFLSLKPSTIIYARQVDWYGRIINSNGVKMHPKSYRDLAKIKLPTTIADLSRFIGAMQYVATDIPRFYQLMTPLRQLHTEATRIVGSKNPKI
jgi:hypothetical protein